MDVLEFSRLSLLQSELGYRGYCPYGLRFRVQGLGSKLWGPVFRVQGLVTVHFARNTAGSKQINMFKRFQRLRIGGSVLRIPYQPLNLKLQTLSP